MRGTCFIFGDDGTAYNAQMISAVRIYTARDVGYAILQIRLVDGEEFDLCKETFPERCKCDDEKYIRALTILKIAKGDIIQNIISGFGYNTRGRVEEYERNMRERRKAAPPPTPPRPLPNEHKE